VCGLFQFIGSVIEPEQILLLVDYLKKRTPLGPLELCGLSETLVRVNLLDKATEVFLSVIENGSEPTETSFVRLFQGLMKQKRAQAAKKVYLAIAKTGFVLSQKTLEDVRARLRAAGFPVGVVMKNRSAPKPATEDEPKEGEKKEEPDTEEPKATLPSTEAFKAAIAEDL